MRERPILFSAPMVRAILGGTKTQTRRMVKCNIPICGVASSEDWVHCMAVRMPVYPSQEEINKKIEQIKGSIHPLISEFGHLFSVRCPYGKPGDRLWVREAFSGPHSVDGLPPSEWNPCAWNCPIWYWADGNPIQGDWTRPRPSIHMPRWASRILLEVTGVRVERIQDISEADAQAEGIVSRRIGTGDARTGCRDAFGLACDDSVWASSTIQAYGALWESINGPDSWSANPWVWVVEFRRVLEVSNV